MTFDDLRALASGFQPAQLVLTALRVGLFDVLAKSPLSASSIGVALGLDARATEIAANGLVSLGLLQRVPEGYANGEPAERFLVRHSADYRGEILLHLHATWEDWGDLEQTWRTGSSSTRRKSNQLPSSPEGLTSFILGMENVTRELAPMLANLLPLESCRAALDLGGGPGNYALAFVRRWPELRVTHFDLPPTSRIAQTFVFGKEGADRIVFREGDFLVDSLGGPYEFVWASQIVHMVGEVQVQELLQRVAGVLRPGGRVAIHDQFLDDSRTSPHSAAMFGVHMLVATQGGRTYSFDEMERWSRKCGLIPEERVDYGGPSRILLARK